MSFIATNPIPFKVTILLLLALLVGACASPRVADVPSEETIGGRGGRPPLNLKYIPLPSRRVVKFIRENEKDPRLDQYAKDWMAKVERVGNVWYPEEARGKLYGELVVSAWIRSDGSLERVEIDRSSGHAVLDEAARNIVMKAEPFAPLASDISRDVDILVIRRTWSFKRGR